MSNVNDDSGKKKTPKQKNGGKWLRSWRSKVSSRKVFGLSDCQYRFWDMALCLTDADGYLPSSDEIGFALRMSVRDVELRLSDLVELRFFDPIVSARGLIGYRAHDWDHWQRRCDETDPTAAGRMRRYRQRKRNAAVTVTEFCSESVSESERTITSVSDPAKKEGKEVKGSVCARGSR